MAMTNHFTPMVRAWSLGVVGATTGAMTNQFRSMVRAWSLSLVRIIKISKDLFGSNKDRKRPSPRNQDEEE